MIQTRMRPSSRTASPTFRRNTSIAIVLSFHHHTQAVSHQLAVDVKRPMNKPGGSGIIPFRPRGPRMDESRLLSSRTTDHAPLIGSLRLVLTTCQPNSLRTPTSCLSLHPRQGTVKESNTSCQT